MILCLLSSLLVAAALAVAPGSAAQADRPYVPPTELGNPAWETVDPAKAGWDPAALAELSEFLEATGTRGFVLLQGGRIVLESYGHGWDRDRGHRVFSVTKGMVATLAHRQFEREVLRPSDPASKWLGSGWTKLPPAEEKQITLHHLLTMTSGLDEDFRRVAAPGKMWFYNSPVYRELWGVLEAATGKGREALAETEIWQPIGMHSTRMAFGNEYAFSTARDLARFGLAMSRGGRWDADTAVLDDPESVVRMTALSQKHNPSYGQLWWIGGGDFALLPGGKQAQGSLAPSAPDDLFAALGAFGQKVYVAPSLDLVVVRLGKLTRYATGQYDEAIWKRIRRALGQ